MDIARSTASVIVANMAHSMSDGSGSVARRKSSRSWPGSTVGRTIAARHPTGGHLKRRV
jgi:hypothetical protein